MTIVAITKQVEGPFRNHEDIPAMLTLSQTRDNSSLDPSVNRIIFPLSLSNQLFVANIPDPLQCQCPVASTTLEYLMPIKLYPASQ